MKQIKYIILAVIILSGLIVLSGSVYIVDETQQVIITQFGKPVGKPILTTGIHFKIPFIQKANFFDKRFLEWDGDPNEIPTKDKRFIWVDTYARWRIADPLLYFQRVQNEMRAISRLSDILDGETRNAIAKNDLVEIVRSTNRQHVVSDANADELDLMPLKHIDLGREKITRQILVAAAGRTAKLGIELLDVRLKRINYTEKVRNKIFERMIAERKRKADKFRSEGQGEYSKILGDKERDLKQIRSEAYKTAQEIIGKADGEATAIYARAYNKNQGSREFYRFLKTMETYQNTMSEKDWLVLSTEGDFFRYLQKQSGR